MPPATIPSSTSSGSSSAMAWLRTREGKLAAGAAAGLLVVVLALGRRSSSGGGAGFSPEQLATGPDKTLQDRLDQIGFRGGTLEEWISATTGLSGEVGQLRDLIDAGNRLPPATPESEVMLQRIGRVGTSYDPWEISRQYAADPTHRDSIEAMLRKIVELNTQRTDYVPLDWGPGATIPGGYPLLVPKVKP